MNDAEEDKGNVVSAPLARLCQPRGSGAETRVMFDSSYPMWLSRYIINTVNKTQNKYIRPYRPKKMNPEVNSGVTSKGTH